jgi:hypothetical protein
MSRKVVGDDYFILDHDNNYKDCGITLGKGAEKIKLGFYLKHLQKLETLLRLTIIQCRYLNTISPVTKPYSPVAIMLTVNFKSPDKVQVNKFISDLRHKMEYDLSLRGENKLVMLNYICVREIHETPPQDSKSFTKQPKPKPHHHFILTYCANSFSPSTIKKLLTTSNNPDGALSLRRYYAINSEGYLRLPKISKKYEKALDDQGKPIIMTVLKNNGSTYETPKVRVSVAEYYFTRSMYSVMQHFSYICKVYTKEQEDQDKVLVAIPGLDTSKMLDNLSQLKRWLTDRSVVLPDKLYSVQPRVNAKAPAPLEHQDEVQF